MLGIENILSSFENIELALPANVAYVATAKQTAFSIAGRLGFDAMESHDIKIAVSEACAFLIKRLTGGGKTYKITFSVSNWHIHIRLSCPSAELANCGSGDCSLTPIRSLMDEIDIIDCDGLFEIVMSKRHIEGFVGT